MRAKGKEMIHLCFKKKKNSTASPIMMGIVPMLLMLLIGQCSIRVGIGVASVILR